MQPDDNPIAVNKYIISYVSALPECHHQNILMLTQAAPPNWDAPVRRSCLCWI